MMEDEKEEHVRTFMDCVKVDRYDLEQIQKDLDLAIGHDMRGVAGKIYYRQHFFEVKLLGKLQKDGSLC